MFFFQLFDRLRREKPDFANRIKVIDGYLENPLLGLSSSDRDWLVKNVNFVFHCAATVKFNETLDLAAKINIQGTEQLLALATEMENLKVFNQYPRWHIDRLVYILLFFDFYKKLL